MTEDREQVLKEVWQRLCAHCDRPKIRPCLLEPLTKAGDDCPYFKKEKPR